MININRLNQNNEYTLGNPEIQVKKSTLKMRETVQSSGMLGKLIPITIHEVLPSETTRMKQAINIEFTPFITNIIHEINGTMSSYFVPYRIIWDKWERFITGCDEEEDITDGSIIEELPRISIFKINNKKLSYKWYKEETPTEEEINTIIEIINEEVERQRIKYNELNETNIETFKLYAGGEYRKPTETTLSVGLKNLLWTLENTQYNQNFKRPAQLPIGFKASGQQYTTNFLRHAQGTSYDRELTIEETAIFYSAINKIFTETLKEDLLDYYGFPITYNTIAITATGPAPNYYTYENVQYYTNVTNITGQQRYDNNPNSPLNPNFFDNFWRNRSKLEPISLNFRAYNKIYNDWIRQLDWEKRREIEDTTTATGKYAWDIFTRARRYQVRGAMPTVPVEINFTLEPNDGGTSGNQPNIQIGRNDIPDTNPAEPKSYFIQANNSQGQSVRKLTIDKQGTWKPIDMLTPVGLLNYYMANAKIKPRYANFLLARWGIQIQDERYQYAQFIGSANITITQNGITQTAPQIGDSTAQGNITGQAWGEGFGDVEFYAPEHGVIITILQLRPANAYELGFDAQYQKQTRFDYPTPELVDTPDVPIYKNELAPNTNATEILGYKAIYDEYRTKFNKVTGLLRPSLHGSLGAKTLARYWDNNINMQSLIQCDKVLDRVKQFLDQPDFMFIKETNFANSIPLPYINDPRIYI